MGKNQSTFTAELRIKAIIDEAQKELNAFGNSLQKAWASGEPPKSMSKAFEQMRARLESIREISKKGVVNTSDLRRAEQDYQSFQKDIHNLTIEFKLMSTEQKRAMLGTEEQENMRARAAAIKEYIAALEKNNKTLQQREALEKEKNNIAQGQDPKRRLAKITIQDNTERLNRLKSAGGPVVLSKDAQEYKDTLNEQAALLAKIQQAQIRVNALSKRGLKDGGNNQLTETKKELEGLINQQEKFNNLAGKAEYEEALNKYNEEISSLEASIASANEDIKIMDEAFEEIDNQLKKMSVKDMEAEFNTLKKRLKELGVEGVEDAKDLNELKKVIQDLDNKAIAGVDEEIKKMVSNLKKMGTTAQQAKQGMDSATDSIQQQTEAMRQQEAFENRIKQFLGLSGAAQVLRSALRDAMSTIKELDATMTEMAVVTDLSVGDYWDQLPEYSARASELGVSVNDAYKAATLYYQQGLKTNEVTAISAETLKLAKVAGIDAAEATDKMTAALRGFNMELNDMSAKRVADVYSELAAITAADVDEISSAMTKTASIASSAGMEFETTAAFLSQIIETTRESAETAGTALKTVIARFQELKKDPSEIGEVDGEIIDANKIETALRSVGVALRDSSGQFRELDDVFLELSSKWDGLDTNTQRYIATIAAGSRQQSRFIAMMQDYGRTQELVAAANNSAGASNRQFEKTMDSLQAKMEKLKNAWHEFTMGIMDSELVKTGVDILTKLLEVVNKATGALDGVWGSLTKIVSVIGIFKLGKQIFEKFMPMISGFFGEIETEAGESGTRAGMKFWKNFENAKNDGQPKTTGSPKQNNSQEALRTGYYRDKNGRIHGPNGRFATEEDAKRTGWEKFGDTTIGLDKWQEGISHGKKKNKAKEALKDLEKGTKEYAKKQKEFLDETQQMWNSYGAAINKVGSSITAVGTATMAVGGILSSMGFEEVGDFLSQAGGWLTIIGAGVMGIGKALTMIPPLLTAISTHPIIAIIVAVLAVILISIIAISTAIENASPEAKLKKAQEAAEHAGEAADAAAESYQNLVDSLDGLKDKYSALEDLTQNTKEWNEAVNEINGSVLDLIDTYPELAKAVKNVDGVLTLDFEDEEVKKALSDAETRKVVTKNASILANVDVAKAENEVAYKNLSDDAKINPGRANAAFGTAMAGTTLAGAGVGAGIGAGAGAALSLLTGPFAPLVAPITAGLGAVVGGVVGTIGGAIAGLFTGEAAKEASFEKTQSETDQLAEAIASGKILPTEEDIKKELEGMGYAGEEAAEMAKRLAENADDLREYGNALIETKAQEMLAYDSIAQSALSLADTVNWSAEQIRQGGNIVDGERAKELYDTEKQRLEGKDLKDLNDDEAIMAAVKEQYGEGATLSDDGTIKYNDGTEDKTVTLTKEQLIAMSANKVATDKSAELIGKTDEAMATIKSSVDAGTADALDRLLQDPEGSKLLSGDIGKLGALSDEKLNEIWTKLEKEGLSEVFGSKDAFLSKIRDPLSVGKNKFLKSNNALQSMGLTPQGYMSAGAQETYATKMAEVFSKEGGAEGVKAIEEKISNAILHGGVEETSREGVMAAINSTNWSSLEELKRLQYDLINVYGMEETAAGELVDAITVANEAFSHTADQIDTYGELYQATQKLNHSMKKLTNLQWAYDNAVEKGSSNLNELVGQMLEEYNTQALEYQKAYEASSMDLAKLYAQGNNTEKFGVDLRDFVTISADGLIDASGLENAFDIGLLTSDQKEAANDWVTALQEQSDATQEQLEGLQSTLDSIEELEQAAEDAYIDLSNMVKDTIVNNLQKQIDLEQQTLDATKEANAQLINKLQEQINASRQERQNEKTEKNISNLQTRMAYLGMDTSGANGGAILDLNQQIADAEQEYQDSLIDQSIQKLQDANAKAEQQREKQISIAQSQLELYTTSNEFQQQIAEKVATLSSSENWQETELGQMIVDYYTKGMNQVEKENWEAETAAMVELANAYKTTDWGTIKNNTQGIIDQITASASSLGSTITSQASAIATQVEQAKSTTVQVETTVEVTFSDTPSSTSGSSSRTPGTQGRTINQMVEISQFATGGLADFTGPAWLDGTKSRPEYVLNAKQTERFFSLVDVLEGIDTQKTETKSSGDNYFDISINVDKLENDYDVEQVADKIRRMIYDDATYRNVNSINHIR